MQNNYTSLRNKFVLLLIILVVLAVAINTWLHVRSSLQARQEEMEARAIALGEFVGLKFVDQFLTGSRSNSSHQQMKFWVEQVPDAVFLAVYTTDGEVIFQHAQDDFSIPSSDKVDPKFIRQLVGSDLNVLGRRIKGTSIYDMLIPVSLFDTEIGLVRLGLDGYRLQNDRREIIITNLQYGSGLLLLITLIGYILTPYIIEPLKRLESVAQEFASGNLSARADVQSGDEIEQLAEQFNSMANRLEKEMSSFEEMEKIYDLFPYLLSLPVLYQKLVEQLSQSLDVDNVALFMFDDDQSLNMEAATVEARVFYSPNDEKDSSSSDFTRMSGALRKISELPMDSSTNERIKRKRFFSEVDGFDFEPSLLQDLIVLPIGKDQPQGYFVLGRKELPFTGSDINFAKTIVNQTGTILHNGRSVQKLLTNPETGLYERDVMAFALEEALTHTDQFDLMAGILEVRDSSGGSNCGSNNGSQPIPASMARSVRDFSENYEGFQLDDASDQSRRGIIAGNYYDNRLLIIFINYSSDTIKQVGQDLISNLDRETGPEEQMNYFMGIVNLNSVHPDRVDEEMDNQLDRALVRGNNSVCVLA